MPESKLLAMIHRKFLVTFLLVFFVLGMALGIAMSSYFRFQRDSARWQLGIAYESFGVHLIKQEELFRSELSSDEIVEELSLVTYRQMNALIPVFEELDNLYGLPKPEVYQKLLDKRERLENR
jgi:hypothetical protein